MTLTFFKDNKLDKKFTVNANFVIQKYLHSIHYKNYGFNIPVFCTYLGLEYGSYDLFTDDDLNNFVKIYKSLKK